jgi:hypothetical protein
MKMQCLERTKKLIGPKQPQIRKNCLIWGCLGLMGFFQLFRSLKALLFHFSMGFGSLVVERNPHTTMLFF